MLRVCVYAWRVCVCVLAGSLMSPPTNCGDGQQPKMCCPLTCPLTPPSSYGTKVEHYRVRRNDSNWVTVDDEEYFENLVKLVEVQTRTCMRMWSNLLRYEHMASTHKDKKHQLPSLPSRVRIVTKTDCFEGLILRSSCPLL